MKKWRLLGLVFLACAAVVAPAKQLGYRELFDGKDLRGWKHVGPGGFTVEHGLLRGYGGMGLLYWADGPFGDCEIKIVYRMTHENDNSGVFIRIPMEPTEPWMPVNKGYEVQIDNHPELGGEDDYHITGTLYSLTKPLAKPGKPGPEWNTMVIRLEGPHTQVFLNDMKVTDYTEGQPVPPKKLSYEPDRGLRPDKGWIGLQNHSNNDIVEFKSVSVLSLGPEQDLNKEFQPQ
jgi:Domain of Unknown Function (DUF1080)